MQGAGAAGQAPLAIDAALGEIARLEASLSTWHDDSTLSAYNAGHLATEALPHDVAAVLALCERWRVRTSDAFSCRLGSLIRSEEHTSELQSLMRISYAVFCLKKKQNRR